MMCTALRMSIALGLVLGSSLHPVPVQSQRPPRQLVRIAAMPAPQGVTVSWTRPGVQITWQSVGEAAQYLVLRSPDPTTAGTKIAELAPSESGYLDRGFNAPAAYQIVAVAADGRQGASAPVQYTPPAELVSASPVAPVVTTAQIAPIAKQSATSATATLASPMPVTEKRERPTGYSLLQPPVIETVGESVSGLTIMHNGDTVAVTGSGLSGLSSVVLADGYCNQPGCKVNPTGTKIPVTPLNASATGFSFVPQVPAPYTNQLYTYFLIVTKTTGADTSSKLDIGAAEPVRKITGVRQTVVRSGLRFDITGIGLGDVIGAYFGNGTPGSQSNPLFSIANRSNTALQIMTTSTCSQDGILMLTQPRPGGGSDLLITGDTVMRVACVPATPSGYVAGTEGLPDHTLPVLAGTSVVIKGTYLKYVTRVLDQRQVAHPFKFTAGFQSVPDMLTITLPTPQPNQNNFGFYLENSLTDPIVGSSVAGSVIVMVPPTWYRISPTWAEPGQVVWVNGHNLKYLNPLKVSVGGVAAEVLQADPLVAKFRLGSGTTAGPIEIENEAGKVQLTGQFTAGDGSTHPGFFVVSGPSKITAVVAPRPTLAYGDTLLVQGENLARLNGICVTLAQNGTTYTLRRLPIGRGLGLETSNTEMKVSLETQPYFLAKAPVQLSAPTTPPGDYAPTQFACAPNPGAVEWP